MKPETLLDSIQYIDEDLIARAEARTGGQNKVRRFPRRFVAVAACLALLIGTTAAFAAGALDPLLSYFGGESEPYLEEILSAGASVSNETLKLRMEGAIADSRTCHMLVSFLGLTPESKDSLSAGDLNVQDGFALYALTPEGERVEFSSTQSATYTDGGRKAVSAFEDAQQTYLLTGNLAEGTTMADVETVCFAYDGLVLKLDVGKYLCPEYQLKPDPAAKKPEILDFHVSRIGFYYTAAAVSEEDFLKLIPIRADGSLYKTFYEDYGVSAGSSRSDDSHEPFYVTGQWCAGSPVALAILELEDYAGFQVNGVNYYFVTE